MWPSLKSEERGGLHGATILGIMIMVKVRDGHDAGLRSLHSCIESDSNVDPA